MYRFKNKLLISVLMLLVFVSQVSATAIPCKMNMQNKMPQTEMALDHTTIDHTTMNHSTIDHSTMKHSTSMDCCDQNADCSMGGCISVLASFGQLPLNPTIIQAVTSLFTFSIIEQIINSLYRPPISI